MLGGWGREIRRRPVLGLGNQVLHLVDQGLGVKRLGNMAISTHLSTSFLIEGFESPGEQQDRRVAKAGVCLNFLANLIAI